MDGLAYRRNVHCEDGGGEQDGKCRRDACAIGNDSGVVDEIVSAIFKKEKSRDEHADIVYEVVQV